VTFKYGLLLATCPEKPCPSNDDFRAGTITGYRLIHWPLIQDDFKPLVLLKRCSEARKKKCAARALSFYVSAEAVRGMVDRVAERGTDVTGWLGTQMCTIDILETDGLISEPTQEGRFSLHEFQGVSLAERVVHLGPVIEDAAQGGNLAS
jgi:hypothetical protein